LVLEMCRKLGADAYVFGTLGRDYAKVEDFQRANIRIGFQDYRHPQYPQLHGGFVPHLSIIDLLFNCGPNSLEVLMKDQQRITL
jgi:WbqC-like protein family